MNKNDSNKEISFIEAVRAYHKGKTVQCIIDDEKYTYSPIAEESDTEITTISDDWGDGLSSKEILDGKWYIKEDSNS